MTTTHDSALDPLFGQVPDTRDLQCRQQLSALMDGCLAADQERFLLRRLQHDAELGRCWERWQVYGDMMRGHAHAMLPAGFADGVASAIARQDALPQAATHAVAAPQRALRWGGTAALAASVALVAFFAGRHVAPGGGTLPADGHVVMQPALQPAVPVAALSAPAPEAVAPEPEVPATDSSTLAQAGAGVVVAAAAAARPGRTTRRASERMPVASDSASPAAVARATAPAAVASQPTALPEPTQADPQVRPWPKARLPGTGDQRALVGYAPAFAAPAVSDPDFAPFQPRLPLHASAQPPAEQGDDATSSGTTPQP